jgi:hypothetical protein
VITKALAAAATIAEHFARSSPITLIRVPTPFTENLKSGTVPRSGEAKIAQRKNKRASQEPTVNGRENSLHWGKSIRKPFRRLCRRWWRFVLTQREE